MTIAKSAELSLTGCPPLSVGMVLYPGFTLLDLAGPQTAFGLNGTTHLIWKSMEPVSTDMGVSLNPTKTFANAPDNLDVLFVPGGFGTVDAMQDREILDYLARAGKTARYITSVCTGSVILGMAGLLDGYRAATIGVSTSLSKHSVQFRATTVCASIETVFRAAALPLVSTSAVCSIIRSKSGMNLLAAVVDLQRANTHDRILAFHDMGEFAFHNASQQLDRALYPVGQTAGAFRNAVVHHVLGSPVHRVQSTNSCATF